MLDGGRVIGRIFEQPQAPRRSAVGLETITAARVPPINSQSRRSSDTRESDRRFLKRSGEAPLAHSCIATSGNGAVAGIMLLLSILYCGDFRTAAIRSQKHSAEAFLVAGATQRYPARWPSWGRRLQKRVAPLFNVTYRT